MPYNMYDRGPGYFYAQQNQQRGDKFRQMMNMLMMMQQMKQGQGRWEKEFGLKEAQQQRFQEEASRQQEQWELQKKEHEQKQQYFAEHPELKGLLYAGINPQAETRAERRLQLDEDAFDLTKQQSRKQLELLDLNIDNARKKLKSMPTEFVNLFMTQALQEKQGMEGQLQQQIINMNMLKKEAEIKAAKQKFVDSYDAFAKQNPYVGKNNAYVLASLYDSVMEEDYSGIAARYEGANIFAAYRDQFISAKQAEEQAQKTKIKQEPQGPLAQIAAGFIKGMKRGVGIEKPEEKSVVPETKDPYKPNKAVIFVTDKLKEARRTNTQYTMTDLVTDLQGLDEQGKKDFLAKYGLGVDWLIEFIISKMMQKP